MDNKFLAQEEIDALLNGDDNFFNLLDTKPDIELISLEEADVLGEVGNISMGSAATTLSQLLNQKVLITSPSVKVCKPEELFTSFSIPYLAIEVNFIEGLIGLNLLIMKLRDASVIADMMMGGDGKSAKEELTEIEMSAAAEAMNQMIGTAATSIAQMFETPINISPPKAKLIDGFQKDYKPFPEIAYITIVSFKMTIGDLIDTEIMQIMSVEVAKKQVEMLSGGGTVVQEEVPTAPIDNEPAVKVSLGPQEGKEEAPKVIFNSSLGNPYDLLLDIPLKVSVILGRSKRTISQVLRLMPGSIVELDKVVNEDVDVLVNGTLVAKGEVVVVGENFGIRIKNIITPAERIHHIR